MSIGSRPFRSGDFSEAVPLSSGRAFAVTAREGAARSSFATTCAAYRTASPTYTFTRYGPVSPKYFAVSRIPTSAT